MLFIPISLIAAGLLSTIALVLLLLGDAALPGRISLTAASILALGGGALLLGGLLMLEGRHPGPRDQRS